MTVSLTDEELAEIVAFLMLMAELRPAVKDDCMRLSLKIAEQIK